jgi:hypothetical protein
MKIIPIDDLGNTPARINRKTGDIFINKKIWFSIPEKERKFILLHELGHYKLQTKDEIKADDYAFRKFAGTEPYSLKAILHAIADNLDITHNPEHAYRFEIISKKLLQWDADHGNPKAKKFLEEMKIEEDIKFLPPKNRQLLHNMLIDFLKKKGINSLRTLTTDERRALMEEFFLMPQVLYLLKKTAEMQDSFLGGLFGKKEDQANAAKAAGTEAKKHKGIGGIIGSVIGAAGSLVASAFGIPVPPNLGASVGGAIGGLFDSKKGTHSQSASSAPKIDYDTQAWKTALTSNSIPAYKAYLTQYPTGKYAFQAKSKIKEIDDKAYNQARTTNTVEAYQAYMSKLPDGSHISEAQAAIKKLKQKKTMMIGGGIGAVSIIIIIIIIFLKR